MVHRLLALGLGLISSLLLCEVAARIFVGFTGEFDPVETTEGGFGHYDELLGYRPRPGAAVHTRGPEFDIRYVINERGLRQDQVVPYERIPGRQRILIAGDSFTFGHGVSNADRYADRLETRLAATEIVNMGVNGWGTDQQLLFYLEEGVKYDADVLVLVYLTSHILRNLGKSRVTAEGLIAFKPHYELRGDELVLTNVPVPKPREPQERESLVKLGSEPGRYDTGVPIPFKSFLRENSSLYLLLRSRGRTMLRDLFRTRPESLPEYAEGRAEWRLTRAILLEFAKQAREHGSRFLVAILPDKAYIENDYLLDTPQRMIRALGAEAGFPVLDLRPALSAAHAEGGEAIYFRIDAHLNPAGHEVVAAALADDFIRAFDFERAAE